MRVFASIPELRVTKKGIERTKEIYTLCVGSDLSGATDRPPALGAYNETLGLIAPEVTAALKYFVISASNLFHRIKYNQPASLSGGGIILYPPADPMGLLALHIIVVESDHGARRAGKVLGDLAKDKKVKGVVQDLSKAAAAGGLAPAALTAAIAALIPITFSLLEKNGDDLLFEHGHSGFDFDQYGAHPDGKDSEVGNDRARIKLRIRTLE